MRDSGQSQARAQDTVYQSFLQGVVTVPEPGSAPTVDSMELGARKRRKWDVAAPQGVPAAQTTTSLPGALGVASAQPKPGQPLTEDLKARAQQAAAAAVAKISQASYSEVLQNRRRLSFNLLTTCAAGPGVSRQAAAWEIWSSKARRRQGAYRARGGDKRCPLADQIQLDEEASAR